MSNKKTLLLSASYEVIRFISFRKMIKLLVKDKIEIESSWDEVIYWDNGQIQHPAVVRLKNHVKRNYFNSNFSRKALVKRDKSRCQYCNTKLSVSQVTIDHVIPKAQGGITSFTNCVVSCQIDNNKKADKTPEQAGMTLLKRPTHPSFSAQHYISDNQNQEEWHESWSDFLSNC
jgi:5-methylcytosine-specific restriction endonuclease McrA